MKNMELSYFKLVNIEQGRGLWVPRNSTGPPSVKAAASCGEKGVYLIGQPTSRSEN